LTIINKNLKMPGKGLFVYPNFGERYMKTNNSLEMINASLLLLSLIFAFAVTSCGGGNDGDGNGGSPSALEGTWLSVSGDSNILIQGKNFKFLGGEIYTYAKGTFTLQKLQEGTDTITLNFSQFSFDDVKWYNRTRFIDEVIKDKLGYSDSRWNEFPNDYKDEVRGYYTNIDSPNYIELPSTEAGNYLLDDNTLFLYSDSVSGTYYRDGENPGPGGWTPLFYYATLTINQWSFGNIPMSGASEQWFSFTATLDTQCIHVTTGTLNDLYLQVYNSSGGTVRGSTHFPPGSRYTSLPFKKDQTYYIKVTPYNSGDSGTYQIAFNTVTTAPGADSGSTWNPPVTNTYTTLTDNVWAEGYISSVYGNWYAFTVTAGNTYYVWWNDSQSFGSVDHYTADVTVSAYYSDGTPIFSQTETAWITPRSFTANSGGTVYVKVVPRSPTGSFAIAYTTTDVRPTIRGTWAPQDYTILIEGVWSSGNIPTSGEQWYRFIATASPQYIHITFGTLDNLYVQVYNSSGDPVGDSSILNTFSLSPHVTSPYTQLSLVSGQTYYIKVTPYSINSGTYDIGFNRESTRPYRLWPPASYTWLTEDQWFPGENEQWFRFTATAVTQHIHVNLMGLTDLAVNVYNSSGGGVGPSTNMYLVGYASTVRTLTLDQNYYIKVSPYTGKYGNYRIAFNTSRDRPW
jgi:hypothetical protein